MHRTEHPRYRVPAKTFLLGEYLALTGRPSLIATFGPMFEVSQEAPLHPGSMFHPSSPAGRISTPDFKFYWRDPFEGSGGFGASSAQFLGALAISDRAIPSPARALLRFREVTSIPGAVPPSGADILAQLVGGLALVDTQVSQVERINVEIPNLIIFSATEIKDQKTPTHSHLAELQMRGFPEMFAPLLEQLDDCTQRGVAAVRSRDWTNLGQTFTQYGAALRAAGFEAPITGRAVQRLIQHDSVLGAKGSGALQSDSVVVLVNSDAILEPVIELGRSMGLRCVLKGFVPGPGMEQT